MVHPRPKPGDGARRSAPSGSTSWIVGDVHGCFVTLSRLLRRAGVDFARDRLVLVGDLVNRGPRSLEVLRWAVSREREMGARFTSILGNHDLHLLARARGLRAARRSDTLDTILQAPDREELVAWLARRPLALALDGTLVVHAGVAAPWTVDDTLNRAQALSEALQGPPGDRLLLSGRRTDQPATPEAVADDRADLETLTRVRMLDADGRPAPYAGPPDEAPAGLTPWFDVPGRATAETTIVFGHWAALGLYVGPGLFGLDSGCAWGRRLTALRLPDGAIVQQEVADDELPRGPTRARAQPRAAD